MGGGVNAPMTRSEIAKRAAERRRCPVCDRKGALVRAAYGRKNVYRCRWCGEEGTRRTLKRAANAIAAQVRQSEYAEAAEHRRNPSAGYRVVFAETRKPACGHRHMLLDAAWGCCKKTYRAHIRRDYNDVPDLEVRRVDGEPFDAGERAENRIHEECWRG